MPFFKKHRVLAALCIVCAVLVLAAVPLIWISAVQNETILLTSYTVTHEQIPASFEGKRIVQVTDLHNKEFGMKLTDAVREQEPDVIVITGDMISRSTTDATTAVEQIEALTAIAPVFYVAGNHEGRSPLYASLASSMRACGVTILEDRSVTWTVNDESIQLIGAYPPAFGTYLPRDIKPLVNDELYSILLLHQPDLFEHAVACGADLVISGHTHGGQIRLPLIGAFYAPDQGFFPRYDVGQFEKDGSTLILSQGLGEAALMRILTPPELVTIVLDSPYA